MPAAPRRRAASPRVLVIDVGGTWVKLGASGRRRAVRVPSGKRMTAAAMVDAVRGATAGWRYDVVTIGYPGPVVDGRPAEEPVNLAGGWVGFDYARALARPIRVLNDAALQALGSYRSGRMLFLGLGTGLGSALVADGTLVPLELAHLPYRRGRTFEGYLGVAGRRRLGWRRWRKHVIAAATILRHALQADRVVLGGGASKRLRPHRGELPPGVRIGDNHHAIRGGIRLWEGERRSPASRPES